MSNYFRSREVLWLTVKLLVSNSSDRPLVFWLWWLRGKFWPSEPHNRSAKPQLDLWLHSCRLLVIWNNKVWRKLTFMLLNFSRLFWLKEESEHKRFFLICLKRCLRQIHRTQCQNSWILYWHTYGVESPRILSLIVKTICSEADTENALNSRSLRFQRNLHAHRIHFRQQKRLL